MTEPIIYLNFDGTCREAMTFYAKCLGAEVQIMPFLKAKGSAIFPRKQKTGSCTPGLRREPCS